MKVSETENFLYNIFQEFFSLTSLKRIRAEEFKKYINDKINIDYKAKYFFNLPKQRDLLLNFFWEHDHELRDNLKQKGQMVNKQIK